MVQQSAASVGAPYRSPIKSGGVRALILLGASAVVVLSLFSAGATADQGPSSESVQQPVAEPGNATLDTVTVEGQRQRELLEDRISAFVSSITLNPRQEALARWQVPICPLVAGLPRDRGESVFGRVSQVARDAGSPLAPQECSPNFIVIMTREPEAMLRKWWSQNHRLFNKDRGTGGINRFIGTAEPIRVWYNACSQAPGWTKSSEMGRGLRCGTWESGSRLTWDVVSAIYTVIVVVDLRRIAGLNDGQLADYIAMVGLAQIRKNSELGTAPTILRLFAEPDVARPQGLSGWDQAFLKSLYGTDSGDVTQLSQIKHRMKRDLVP